MRSLVLEIFSNSYNVGLFYFSFCHFSRFTHFCKIRINNEDEP